MNAMRLVNIWTRAGLLGAQRMGHSSVEYSCPLKALEGRSIPPEPGWTLVGTMNLETLRFHSQRELERMS